MPQEHTEDPTEKSTLSIEEANELVLEHRGWAESIARSVARAWNLDWQLDGLDGAAMEALIFCARRFSPSRGVPFRGYARKRIHEASAEAARRSRGWGKSSSSSKSQQMAREISVELLQVFPELREGHLPVGDEGEDGDGRAGVRQLLVGASIIAAKQGMSADPEEALDYKRTIRFIAELDPIHQLILWKVYWDGLSMRNVATEWETDELNVIREHKMLLGYLHKCVSRGKPPSAPRVRPGLKEIATRAKRKDPLGPFRQLLEEE